MLMLPVIRASRRRTPIRDLQGRKGYEYFRMTCLSTKRHSTFEVAPLMSFGKRCIGQLHHKRYNVRGP